MLQHYHDLAEEVVARAGIQPFDETTLPSPPLPFTPLHPPSPLPPLSPSLQSAKQKTNPKNAKQQSPDNSGSIAYVD